MKKITFFLLLLISINLFAQEESFPYHLEYWQPMGMEIAKAFPVNDEEYLLIGYVENYSPEDYPGLFTSTATQQQWMGKNGYVSIRTNGDWEVLSKAPIINNDIGTSLHSMGFFKGADQLVYFYYHNIIGRLNSDGSLDYLQVLDEEVKIESMTYHDGLLYGLRGQHINNPQELIPGKIYKLDATNGATLDNYIIGDPTAFFVDYTGVAVDDSGIYVMGTVQYSEFTTGLETDTTFYYTYGAFQQFQSIQTNPLFTGYIGFLTKYHLTNPQQMQWSTYLAGEGSLLAMNSEVPRNTIRLIDNDLFIIGFALTGTTNISTPNTYLESTPYGHGGFLMRFSSSGERLMGTYINEMENPGQIAGGIKIPSFVTNTDDVGRVMVSSFYTVQQNMAISLTSNAPYDEVGTQNTYLQEFTPQGQRLYGMVVSNNGEMNKYLPSQLSLQSAERLPIIAEHDGFKVFCWEQEPALSANYLTTQERIIDYATENKFSVASYNDKPSSTKQHLQAKFSVYPNPTTDVLYVNALSTESITQAKIYDLSGKQLLNLSFDNHQAQQQIAVEHLASGMYIIELASEKHTQKTKFIKR